MVMFSKKMNEKVLVVGNCGFVELLFTFPFI